MRTLFRSVPLPLMVAFATSCASVPMYRYYTIDMRPGADLKPGVQISSVRIDVNQALKRPEILIRTSATRIDYYALDRWASGLDEQLAEKLMTEFSGAPAGAPRFDLSGSLMAFDQVDTPSGAEVHVKMELRAPHFQKIYSHSEQASAATAEAVVDALSRVTEAIAAELAADLTKVVAARENN